MKAKPRFVGFHLSLFGHIKHADSLDREIADVLLDALKTWGVEVVEVSEPSLPEDF